ncbi:hypothetical protein [Serratia inhibens]|uniref:hypothetical protein n=1 Tax=Serratia inhibens TaxID=2338073 RepID=UPI0009038470|nr:hypothetical protein [Serratia inhibens]
MKTIFIFLFFFGTIPTGHTEPMKTVVESPKSILKIEDFLPTQKKWSINTGINILNNITGAAASAALGASAAGASNALFGSIGRGGGRSSCDTCHKAR